MVDRATRFPSASNTPAEQSRRSRMFGEQAARTRVANISPATDKNRPTEFLFEPLDFLARLAALVPRPRSHLLRYHAVLAPNPRHRRLVVPAPSPPGQHDEPAPARARAPMSSMQRLCYVFDIDLRHCPRCGAALRVLALITDPPVLAAMLEHIDTRAARAPPIASS